MADIETMFGRLLDDLRKGFKLGCKDFQTIVSRKYLEMNDVILNGVFIPPMFCPGVNTTASAEAGRMEEMGKWKPESISCCFVTRWRPHMDFQIVRLPPDKLQTHP